MAHRILLASSLVVVVLCSPAFSSPTIASAWDAAYPGSTLPARMAAQTGSNCNVCHHAGPGTQGNCYREDLRDLIVNQGMSAGDAIDQLDTEDSDNDLVPNGVEIMTVREDDSEQVGYNPGLIGDTGTDPCGGNPLEEVTGVSETPGPPVVPTMSEWGVAVMVLLLTTAGSMVLARRRSAV